MTDYYQPYPSVLARLSHRESRRPPGSPGGVVAYGAGQGSEAHTEPGHPPKTPTMNAMDAIRERFGDDAVRYGSASRQERSVPDEFRRLAEKEL